LSGRVTMCLKAAICINELAPGDTSAWLACLDDAFLLHTHQLHGLYGDSLCDGGSYRSCLTHYYLTDLSNKITFCNMAQNTRKK
jgi:hypothetical protein